MVASASHGRPRPRSENRDLLGVVDVLPVAGVIVRPVHDGADGAGELETVYANAAARALGISSRSEGDALLDLLAADERARLVGALHRALEDGETLEERVALRRFEPGASAAHGDGHVVVRGGKVGDALLLTLTNERRPDGDASGPVARAEVLAARSDARRLAVLQRVTAALMSADTVEEVSAITLDELFRAKPLVAGAVVVLDEDTDWLRLAAARGVTDEIVAQLARVPLSSRAWPIVVAARTGKPEFLSSREELLAAYPAQRASRESVTQSIAVLPLEADLGAVGALALSFAKPTRFDDDLREFLLTVARQCARAIERALLVESERVARVRAARLQRITEDLAGAETQEIVARRAVRLLADTLEADGVALYCVGAEEGVLARAASHGRWDDDDLPPVVSLGSTLEVARVVRAKQAHYAGADGSANETARVHLPLLHDGKAIGGVALRFDTPRRFPADARSYCGAIAHQLSLALDRARLREENERRSRHLAALADASALFAAMALDVSALAQSVARFASEAVGDPCVLSLLAEDGVHLETVALEGASPDDEALCWSVFEERRLRVSEGITGAAIVSGQPVLIRVMQEGSLPATLPPPYRELFRRFEGGSGIAVPLRAHGETLGALTLLRGPGPRYTSDDLALLVDIGERAALALYTARLYDETQGAVRVRDDFLSIAGHELRTPLTALHLQLQALVRFPERASSPAVVRERATKMAQQTDRLARLITELLDVSRIVRGRLTLERSDVDLVEVMRAVLEICDADLRRADCEVVVTAPPSLVGKWDRTRIEQVLQNLLLNACKYGRGLPVQVELREEDSTAIVVVRDEGIGIPPEDQARIFERFERAVPSRHFGGFGLGLWISRQVVEAHGGRISVESAPGTGATFRVALPCARGHG